MAGVVARIYNWVTDKANSVKITASRQDAELNQLIVALNKKVLCATSAPSSPIAGQTWVDTTNKIMKIYINNEWVGMGAVHVSTTAPTTLQEGFLWYDTTNNVLKTYSGSAWQSVLSNLSAIDTKTTPVLADSVAIVDSENSDVNKISTLTSIKAAVNTQASLGAWATDQEPVAGGGSATLVKDTVYTAATDGFVVVQAGTGGATSSVEIYTDGSNPPTTLRVNQRGQRDGMVSYSSGMCPVKSGDYWKVTSDNTPTIYWIPLS